VQPQLVEKDFYLTRILWALGQSVGDGLLLKGGTLLSKVDLGFFRMSEDADLVLPGPSSRQRLPNVRRMHRLRDALKEIGLAIGVTTRFPAGELSDKSDALRLAARLFVRVRAARDPSGGIDTACFAGDTRSQAAPAARRPFGCRRNRRQMLCADAPEARAEKVRAALTRAEARDFYDLDRLHQSRADLSSPSFIKLVDAKLTELGAPPMAKQERFSGLSGERSREPDAPRANARLAAFSR
jgi:hypothetical protein